MNYRTIECSDRLPDKEGIYFVIDENGAKFADRFELRKWYSNPIHSIEYWLEPYELPTEEIDQAELEEIAYRHAKKYRHFAERMESFIAGAKYITNLLER